MGRPSSNDDFPFLYHTPRRYIRPGFKKNPNIIYKQLLTNPVAVKAGTELPHYIPGPRVPENVDSDHRQALYYDLIRSTRDVQYDILNDSSLERIQDGKTQYQTREARKHEIDAPKRAKYEAIIQDIRFSPDDGFDEESAEWKGSGWLDRARAELKLARNSDHILRREGRHRGDGDGDSHLKQEESSDDGHNTRLKALLQIWKNDSARRATSIRPIGTTRSRHSASPHDDQRAGEQEGDRFWRNELKSGEVWPEPIRWIEVGVGAGGEEHIWQGQYDNPVERRFEYVEKIAYRRQFEEETKLNQLVDIRIHQIQGLIYSLPPDADLDSVFEILAPDPFDQHVRKLPDVLRNKDFVLQARRKLEAALTEIRTKRIKSLQSGKARSPMTWEELITDALEGAIIAIQISVKDGLIQNIRDTYREFEQLIQCLLPEAVQSAHFIRDARSWLIRAAALTRAGILDETCPDPPVDNALRARFGEVKVEQILESERQLQGMAEAIIRDIGIVLAMNKKPATVLASQSPTTPETKQIPESSKMAQERAARMAQESAIHGSPESAETCSASNSLQALKKEVRFGEPQLDTAQVLQEGSKSLQSAKVDDDEEEEEL